MTTAVEKAQLPGGHQFASNPQLTDQEFLKRNLVVAVHRIDHHCSYIILVFLSGVPGSLYCNRTGSVRNVGGRCQNTACNQVCNKMWLDLVHLLFPSDLPVTFDITIKLNQI